MCLSLEGQKSLLECLVLLGPLLHLLHKPLPLVCDIFRVIIFLGPEKRKPVMGSRGGRI